MRVYNVTISINSTIRVVQMLKKSLQQILFSRFADHEDDFRSCDSKKWVLQGSFLLIDLCRSHWHPTSVQANKNMGILKHTYIQYMSHTTYRLKA